MTDEFPKKLEEFLKQHDKTLEDIPRPERDVPREIVEHVHRISEGGRHYKKLRTFSGKYPTPNGELPFLSWVQHAKQLVEGPDLKEEERRARLAEGLAPPALTIYRKAVQALGPSATADGLLDQLSQAYGLACEGEDLYSYFRDTFQEAGERPSTYLARLEEALDQAVQFGGVPEKDADQMRLTQFIRDCIHSESLVATLQLRNQKDSPPGMVELLREVRIEESAEEARSRRRQSQEPRKTANLKQLNADPGKLDLFQEVENLRAQLQAVQVPPPVQPPLAQALPLPPSPGPQKELGMAELMATIEELKGAVAKLQQEKSPPPSYRGQGPTSKKGLVCYNCGEKGHMLRECRNPTNPVLVQRRLLERCQSGNDGGRPQGSGLAPLQ